jgi:hypothetical protein
MSGCGATGSASKKSPLEEGYHRIYRRERNHDVSHSSPNLVALWKNTNLETQDQIVPKSLGHWSHKRPLVRQKSSCHVPASRGEKYALDRVRPVLDPAQTEYQRTDHRYMGSIASSPFQSPQSMARRRTASGTRVFPSVRARTQSGGIPLGTFEVARASEFLRLRFGYALPGNKIETLLDSKTTRSGPRVHRT